MLPCADLKQLPPDDSYSACVRESHKVMFDTAEKAMAAAGIKPRQVRAGSTLCDAAARVPLSAFLVAEARCQHTLSCALCCVRRSWHGCCLPVNAPACLLQRMDAGVPEQQAAQIHCSKVCHQCMTSNPTADLLCGLLCRW